MVNGVRHNSSLTHPQLNVYPNRQAGCRNRQMFVVNGIAGGERTLKLNDPDLNTLKTALLERVFYHKVGGEYVEVQEPDEGHVFNTLKNFSRRVTQYIGEASPVSPQEFAEMYRGRKRTIYDNAVTDFLTHGVKRSDAFMDSFVKCEKVPSDKSPRCIQPRRPVYNVAVGRYLKPIEHALYRAIQHVFQSDTPVVVKGYNAVETADIIRQKFESFKRTACVGLDASRFDQHVTQQMLRWEHSIYNMIFKSKELRELLKWQIDNVGFGRCDDGTLTYRVKGKRCSGDMNTALGNCLIMCAMVFAYAEEKGIKVDLANNGDDCMVFMDAGSVKKFNQGLDEWFGKMGFIMTVEPTVYNLHEIEFCQTRPVYGAHGLVMCRNFEKAREKDSISTTPFDSPASALKWMGAIGEAGLALTSGVPVFQAIYSAFVRHGVPSKMNKSVGWYTGMMMMARNLPSKWEPITDEARYSFYVAFGITPDEQAALEEYYDNWQFDAGDVVFNQELEDIDSAPF